MPDVNTGIAVVSLVGLAGFTGWLLRDYIADLKGQRDKLATLLAGAISANEHMADELEKLGVAK